MSFNAAIVAAHAASIPGGRWFELVGLPFSDDERAVLASLAPAAARVADWKEARRLADDPRAAAAYDRDAAEVVALKTRALANIAPDELLRVMSAVVDLGLDVFHRAAQKMAARAGIVDEELTRAAAGAATEAVYRGALAAAVEGAPHRFVICARLFASGRWPVARIDDTLSVF
jgi:hypothetical protein